MHQELMALGLPVRVYGTFPTIALTSSDSLIPFSINYGQTYSEILANLPRDDLDKYRQSGLMEILEKAAAIKEGPEYFFDSYDRDLKIIVCCDMESFNRIFEHFSKLLTGPPRHISENMLDTPYCSVLCFEIPTDQEHADPIISTIVDTIRVITEDSKYPSKLSIDKGLRFCAERLGSPIKCAFIDLKSNRR